MKENAVNQNYEKVFLLGKEALFTNFRLDPKTIPKDIYYYDIRGNETNEFSMLEKKVLVNHCGTILVKEPFLELEVKEYINIKDEIDFIGEEITLDEFISKLSKN